MSRKKQKTKEGKNGFMVIVAIIIFAIVLITSITLLDYVTSTRRIAKRFSASSEVLQTAEAGLQKALYCLNSADGTGCGGQFAEYYTGETGIIFDDSTIDIVVYAIEDGIREIASTATGPSGDTVTVVSQAIKESASYVDMGFDYAIMSLESPIFGRSITVDSGHIYTESDLICGGDATILGNAFVSKAGGLISECEIIGDAHADQIVNSNIGGNCFYDTAFDNSLCGGVEFQNEPTPAAQDLPVLDLDFWRAQAESGGVIQGDYEPNDGITLGPVKIEGGLIIGKNTEVTLTGPIWATTGILIEKKATLYLDPTFENMGVLVLADDPDGGNADITIDSNAVINNSGVAGSYTVFASTSTNVPAIRVRNNGGTAIYYAPNGGIRVEKNADMIAAAANQVEIQQRASVLYDAAGYPADLAIKRAVFEAPRWEYDPGTWREL